MNLGIKESRKKYFYERYLSLKFANSRLCKKSQILVPGSGVLPQCNLVEPEDIFLCPG